MRVRIFFTVLLALMVSSCSVFKSSKQIDMAPFSENASIMFGEASKISRPFKWKHLKPYIDNPQFKKMDEKAEPILRSLNGIVYYSQQVVAINNSTLKDKDKNRQLARYLENVLNESVKKGHGDSLGLDPQTLRQIIADIPKAESYLDGIAAASPIVNRVVISVQRQLDDIQVVITNLRVVFDQKIEDDFTGVRVNYVKLKNMQEKTMFVATILYELLTGQRSELDSLLILDNSLEQFFPKAPAYTIKQLESANVYLMSRLDYIDKMFRQLVDDVVEYHAKQDELEEWRLYVDEQIRVARNAITVWAQSHRNLGAGIPVPPLIDVAGFASGLVGSAVKTVIP